MVARLYLNTSTPYPSIQRHWSNKFNGRHQLVTRFYATSEPITQAASAGASWFANFVKNKATVVIAVGVGLVCANVVATSYYDVVYKKAVIKTLEEGVKPPPVPHAFLPRKQLKEGIRGLLHPEHPTRFFSLIYGSPGSGKSTLVRSVCQEMTGGVGYLEVSPATEDFGKDLGEVFNFKFERHVSLFNLVTQTVLGSKAVEGIVSESKLASLRRSAEALHAASVEYRQHTGRPFVLIIDSLDRLCSHSSDKQSSSTQDAVLHALIEYSKQWAEDGSISVVFVADTWNAARAVLQDNPMASRAGPPLLVGDISADEAKQLLKFHLGVKDDNVVDAAVDLVGGSLLLLERLAGLYTSGLDFQSIKQRLIQLMALQYETIHLTQAHLSVFKVLLASAGNVLSSDEWRKHCPSVDDRNEMLHHGILSYDGSHVKFASKLAGLCAAALVAGTL